MSNPHLKNLEMVIDPKTPTIRYSIHAFSNPIGKALLIGLLEIIQII